VAITGYLEFASATALRGWAYDSEAPETHLEVVVRMRDESVASGRADIRRTDLAAVGIGDGSHGFNIDLASARVAMDTVAALEVYAVSGDQTVQLHRTRVVANQITDVVLDDRTPVADEEQFPVFVLGPARSGTSAIALGLLQCGRYEGAGEGHLMPLAHALLGVVDNYYRRYYERDRSETTLKRVPIQAFQRLIRRGFVHLAQNLYGTRYWLDKTPTAEMVRAAPLMRELWPNARFIFMKRRVIENLLSRRRKFPHESTERHYSDWVAIMAAWLAVRDKLAGNALEVEHRQLALDPGAVATAIAALLGLPEEAATRFRQFVTANRPEQTDQNFGATYSFDDLQLKPDEARRMVAMCDQMMSTYGYSYRECYFAECQSNPATAARSSGEARKRRP
jgi:hypothetical protein